MEEIEINLSYSELEAVCNMNFKGNYDDMANHVELGLERARKEGNKILESKLTIDLNTIKQIISDKKDHTKI